MRMSFRRRRILAGYLFISPVILGYLIWVAGPMLMAIWLSLTEWDMLRPATFVGLINYQQMLQEAVASLKSIEGAMSSQGGVQATPDFAGLSVPLARTAKLISDHLSTRAPAAGTADGSGSDAAASSANGGAVAIQGIRSREDAARALDAVAGYFRVNEPSSPIPLLIERTKRLIAKDFLAVLEELAPDALSQAKAASGVRDPVE